MRRSILGILAGLTFAAAMPACNPPTIYAMDTGFQPRSQAYWVGFRGDDHDTAMPEPWHLIDRRELHKVLLPVTTAEVYDMVFFEKVNGDYKGGAATYVWTDWQGPKRGTVDMAARARQYAEQFGKAPLVKLLPGAPDFGCPCEVHSIKETPFGEGRKGVQLMGMQRLGGNGGEDFGFYMAIIANPRPEPGHDDYVVVLHVDRGKRLTDLMNDARDLARRVRWQEAEDKTSVPLH